MLIFFSFLISRLGKFGKKDNLEEKEQQKENGPTLHYSLLQIFTLYLGLQKSSHTHSLLRENSAPAGNRGTIPLFAASC